MSPDLNIRINPKRKMPQPLSEEEQDGDGSQVSAQKKV